MTNGALVPNSEGTMQGGPLSPLLSNIVLDELDQELERRGLSFCRFADDCNIFVRSHKAADRVMGSITQFIEKKLKLKVNQDKSQVATSDRVKLLGFTIVDGNIAIAHAAMQSAMSKVKALTPRGTYQTLEQTIERINQWYVGWTGYYGLTNYPAQLHKIEAHIRRRLRSRIVSQQKRRRHLYRKLVKRGVPRFRAWKDVFGNARCWALSNRRAMIIGYSNSWFTNHAGLVIRSDRKLSHWLDVSLWIRLT